MPTYEYECDTCGTKEELFYANPKDAPPQYRCTRVLGSDPEDDLLICPGLRIRQLGAGAGCIFRGAGFYCNDYPRSKGSSVDEAAPGA